MSHAPQTCRGGPDIVGAPSWSSLIVGSSGPATQSRATGNLVDQAALPPAEMREMVAVGPTHRTSPDSDT